jgi:hypothetical protein
MSQPNNLRAHLMREMHKTGCRLDDAAACADVAIRELRDERNRAIAACVACGVSVRTVAKHFGISHPRVIQIARLVNRLPRVLPRDSATISSAA